MKLLWLILFIFYFASTLNAFTDDYQKLQGDLIDAFPQKSYSKYGYKNVVFNRDAFEDGNLKGQTREGVDFWGEISGKLEIDSSSSGSLRTPYQDETDYAHKEQSGLTLVNTLKLNFSSLAKENLETKISGLFRLEFQHLDDSNVAGRSYTKNMKDYYLTESYLKYFEDNYNVKVGLLEFNWGVVEENSPLDILNPEDLYRNKLILKSERKVPVPALSFNFLNPEYDFETTLGFYHNYNRDPESDSIWREHQRKKIDYWVSEGLTTIEDKREEKKDRLKNFFWGGRLVKNLSDYRWGVSYYYGWDYNNLYLGSNYRVMSGENIPREITIDNKRITAVGFFGETSWNGEVELRGEMAYLVDAPFYDKYKNPSADDNLLYRDKLVFVGEMAHNFDTTSRLLFQYKCSYILSWSEEVDFPETTNEIYLHLIKEVLSKKLTFDFRVFKNFTRDDLYFRPRIYWETNIFKITLGYDFLWGEDERYGWGQYAQNDMAVFEATYKF